MILKKQITIDKNISEAWNVLGPQFTDAYKWASPVNHSKGQNANNEGFCDERACSTSMGKLREKILNYSEEKHSLTYQISEGMPSMVSFASNTWTLSSKGANQSQLDMTINVDVKGFMGKLMAPMMKMQLSKMGQVLVEDFKYYVETQKPHPRKVKAAAKYSAKQHG